MLLLDVLAGDAQGLTAKEIALRLDVPLPTAYRLLQTSLTRSLLSIFAASASTHWATNFTAWMLRFTGSSSLLPR